VVSLPASAGCERQQRNRQPPSNTTTEQLQRLGGIWRAFLRPHETPPNFPGDRETSQYRPCLRALRAQSGDLRWRPRRFSGRPGVCAASREEGGVIWTWNSSPAWLTGFRITFPCRPSAAPVGKGQVRGGIEIGLSRSDRQRLHKAWRPSWNHVCT
jgi:hypothetical protein